ncbi:LemA family protein [Dermatophilaceae bacterium Soc4.6]
MSASEIAAVVGIAVAAVGLVLGLWWLAAHNRFVRQRQHVDESWRDVDVELRRRHDLVPRLVRVVEAHAAHERRLLELLTRERGELSAEVAATAQAYPGLRADALFVDLQHRLLETEARLAAARRIHTSNVQAYNTRVQSVPTNLVARAGRFTHLSLLEPEAPA